MKNIVMESDHISNNLDLTKKVQKLTCKTIAGSKYLVNDKGQPMVWLDPDTEKSFGRPLREGEVVQVANEEEYNDHIKKNGKL